MLSHISIDVLFVVLRWIYTSRTDEPWHSHIHLPLSPSLGLRMHLNSFVLSLVLAWASCKSVYAMPTSKVVVELSSCGMTPDSSNAVLSQQVSTPEPSIFLATILIAILFIVRNCLPGGS